jgi:hypothetical protein
VDGQTEGQTMTLIYPCPDCGTDLDPADRLTAGDWCPGCRNYHDTTLLDDDPDGQRDRAIDDRHAND